MSGYEREFEFEELEELEEVGEFGELGEGFELGGGGGQSEEILGEILGEYGVGEGSPLSEEESLELAAELLEITNEQELEQFLGGLFRKVAKGIGGIVRSPIGRALGGVLKGVAKRALPMVGGALGSFVAPGIGTALGSKLGSMAAGLFEVQGLPQEHAELEIGRRYVNLAASAYRHAAQARPRPGTDPRTVARAALTRSARMYAPGLYRQLAPQFGPPRRRRRRMGYAQPGFAGVGAPGQGMGDALDPMAGGQAGAPSLDSQGPCGGHAASGRWVRRGGRIVLIGV